MEFYLRRREFSERSTIGKLGPLPWEIFTLEDRIRPVGVKVPEQTCIPAGRYKLEVRFSPRFRRSLIHLLDVPMFTNILIHPGNKDEDTKGCILLGLSRAPDWVGSSGTAVSRVQPILEREIVAGGAWLTISNEPTNEAMYAMLTMPDEPLDGDRR